MSRVERKRFQIAGGAIVMLLASLLATSSAASQVVSGQNSTEKNALWQYLSSFNQTIKNNAVIHLHLPGDATSQQRLKVGLIESNWKVGKYEQAIKQLKVFEAMGTPVSLGVSWKNPVPVGFSANLLNSANGGLSVDTEVFGGSEIIGPLSGTSDSRIGGTRTGSSQVVLASSDKCDTIFAAVRWSVLATPAWSLNISADDGVTWNEVYNFSTTSGQMVDVDITGIDHAILFKGIIWVAYIFTGMEDTVLVNQFDAQDGSYIDYSAYFYDTPQAKTEVEIDAIESDHPVVAAIQDDGVLRFYGFGTQPTGVTNAAVGLDFSALHSQFFGATYPFHLIYYRNFFCISYIGTDNRVHVWHRVDDERYAGYIDGVSSLGTFSGSHDVTAVSIGESDNPGESNDHFTIICMFEEAFTYGQGIRFWRSEDDGDSWWEQVFVAPGSGEGDFSMPAMPSYSRNLWPATYTYESTQNVFFSFYDWGHNQWANPVPFDNDHSCYRGFPMSVEWVPETIDEVYGLGLGYIHREWDGMFYRYYPYFDRAPGPGGYCHAHGSYYSTSVYIASVNVGSISRSSGNAGYVDRTELSTQMGIGYSHELTVTLDNGTQSCQGGVWVDWNQDRDFDDAGEAIAVNGSPGAGPYTATISPPVNAVLGETRMRIRVTKDEIPQPCGRQVYGEVEDYTVEVVNYCEASAGCGQYISRVQFANIDNSTGCEGYAYYPGLVGDIQLGLTYFATITIANGYSGNLGGLWFDWNHDLDFLDAGEEISLSPSFGPGPYTAIVTVPSGAKLGLTRMRVRLHRETDWPRPCDDELFGEVEDYVVSITESPYCLALSECDNYISRVQFGSIDNVSDCPMGWYGYSDFTDQGTEMDIGAETPIPMTITIENGEGGDQGAAWIDWNQDMDFNDAGEAIPLTGTPGPGPYTATVMPPLDAMFGDTRMRIRSVRDHEPLSCGEESFGETEDYTVTVNNPGYCIGYGGCTEYIGRVELGDIDNASGCSQGYSNYSHLSTSMLKNEVYELTVTAGQSYPDDRCSVWIDWNQNGGFSDDGESIPVNGTPGMGPYTALIVPRPDASIGQTRMRVRLDWLGPYGPCDAAEHGEVEDYTIEVLGYCEAFAECDAYISRVQIGDINNTSDCNTGYSDYTSLSTEIAMNVSSDITITVGNSAGYEYGAVFIDWNQDTVFGYPSEEVPLNGSPGFGPYTATVTPPPGAVLGETRMRVRVSSEEDPPGPCGPTEYGEVEDYSIVVTQCPRWDLVRDGCVNLEDFAVFAAHWLQSPCPEPDMCGCADLYTDGVVNLSDCRIFATHWLEGCP